MLLEAHRGAAVRYPENTVIAFRGAKAEGYDMIELDPRFTKDGHCVILHDSTINRTARSENGRPPIFAKPIHAIPLEEARKFEFGGWFSPEFTGEPIPTLEDVLSFAGEARIPLKFDNIWHSFTASEQIRFLQMIRLSSAKTYCELTCKDLSAVRIALAFLPDVKIHYDGMLDKQTENTLRQLVPHEQLTVWQRFDNKNTAWCSVPPVSAESAKRIRSFAKLGLWLLTTEEERKQAEELGADIAETDGTLRPITQ